MGTVCLFKALFIFFFHELQLLGTVNSRENDFSFPLKHRGDDLEDSLKDECGKNGKPGGEEESSKMLTSGHDMAVAQVNFIAVVVTFTRTA